MVRVGAISVASCCSMLVVVHVGLFVLLRVSLCFVIFFAILRFLARFALREAPAGGPEAFGSVSGCSVHCGFVSFLVCFVFLFVCVCLVDVFVCWLLVFAEELGAYVLRLCGFVSHVVL